MRVWCDTVYGHEMTMSCECECECADLNGACNICRDYAVNIPICDILIYTMMHIILFKVFHRFKLRSAVTNTFLTSDIRKPADDERGILRSF